MQTQMRVRILAWSATQLSTCWCNVTSIAISFLWRRNSIYSVHGSYVQHKWLAEPKIML